MGITTKIWPATDAEIEACLAEPKHVGTMFVRCEDYAMIHDSREMESLLHELAKRGGLLREVPTASDASFVMSRQAVAEMDDAHRAILGFSSICSNGVQVVDLVHRAVTSDRGLVFCVYEDW